MHLSGNLSKHRPRKLGGRLIPEPYNVPPLFPTGILYLTS